MGNSKSTAIVNKKRRGVGKANTTSFSLWCLKQKQGFSPLNKEISKAFNLAAQSIHAKRENKKSETWKQAKKKKQKRREFME